MTPANYKLSYTLLVAHSILNVFAFIFQVRDLLHYAALGKTSPCIHVLDAGWILRSRWPASDLFVYFRPPPCRIARFLLPPSSFLPLDVFSKRKRGGNERRATAVIPVNNGNAATSIHRQQAASSMQREDRAQKGACPHSDASSNVCGVQSNLCTCFCLKL